MVIDTSAIVAIAFAEPDAASVDVRIANDTVRLISAATVFEASMMLQSRPGEPGGSDWIFGCTGLTPRS